MRLLDLLQAPGELEHVRPDDKRSHEIFGQSEKQAYRLGEWGVEKGLLAREGSRFFLQRGVGSSRVQVSMNELRGLPPLLTAQDAAELLRISRKAVYIMADRGQIPGVTHVGRRLRFRRDDVIRWLNESRASSLKE